MICFFIHPEASIDLGKKVEFKVVYKGKERQYSDFDFKNIIFLKI